MLFFEVDGAPNPANIFYLLIDHLADADNDNDGRGVEITRMGPFCCVDDGTRGTEFFDTFESRPDPYIGLAWQPGRMRAAKQIQKDEQAVALAAHVRPLTVAQVSEVDQILANLKQTQEGLRLAGMGSPAPGLALPQSLRPEPVSVENTRVIRYTYDPLQRLTDARVGEHFFYHYTYDAVGNRVLEETHAGMTTYGYDDANRLTSVDGTAYYWDNNGNLLGDGQRVYTYNHANRLTAVTQGSDAFSYTYNGMGDRLTSTENGVTTEFTLDMNTRLTQVLADGTNTYLYGNGRVAQESDGRAYFLGDALGSVRQLVDQDGQVTLSRSYEPYGEVEYSQGAGATTYGFTGEHQQSSLGLVYLRARYLATMINQFVQPDPIFHDPHLPTNLNRYNYSNNNPINYNDPSGHRACDIEDQNGKCRAYTSKELIGIYKDALNHQYGWDMKGEWSLNEIQVAFKTGYGIEKFVDSLTGGNGQGWMKRNMGGVSISIGPFDRGLGIFGGIILPTEWANQSKYDSDYYLAHELAHIWDEKSGKYGMVGIVDGMADYLNKFIGGDVKGSMACRFCDNSGTAHIPGAYRFTGPGDTPYGNNSTADCFADAFAYSVFNTNIIPSPLVASWINLAVFLETPHLGLRQEAR